jgi:hypothetical protein
MEKICRYVIFFELCLYSKRTLLPTLKENIFYKYKKIGGKNKTIQTLLTSNRENHKNRDNLYVHLHDWSLSCIDQVTSIDIDDVKLVLCSHISLVTEMMRSCKCFLRQ